MRKYILSIALMAICTFLKAQIAVISPVEGNEFCPNTVIEFTVNLPGPYTG